MKHRLIGSSITKNVYLDGMYLDPEPSRKVNDFSQEFDWGYEGSGPAQLALAVVLKLTGSSDGFTEFKEEVIAKIPNGKPFNFEFDYPDSQAIA